MRSTPPATLAQLTLALRLWDDEHSGGSRAYHYDLEKSRNPYVGWGEITRLVTHDLRHGGPSPVTPLNYPDRAALAEVITESLRQTVLELRP